MSRFQVRMSLGDLQNLHQKITNENVLMSHGAVLPLESDGLRKQEFLGGDGSGSVTGEDQSGSPKQDGADTKHFLPSSDSGSFDEVGDTNSLFIKDEVVRQVVDHTEIGTNNPDGRDGVKSELSSGKNMGIVTSNNHAAESSGNDVEEQIATSSTIVYLRMRENGVGGQSVVVEQRHVDMEHERCKNKGTLSGEFDLAHSVAMKETDINNSIGNITVEDKGVEHVECYGGETTATVSTSDKNVVGSALRVIAPRLQSFPLYSSAHNSIGIGKNLLKAYNYIPNALPLLDSQGQYFEVLGRCSHCFRFSRTTSYCRSEKNHREPKANVCEACEVTGNSTVICRRKLNHTAPNAQPLNIVINTALQITDHVKQLCMKNFLPACFADLQSIVIHHADIPFVTTRTTARTLQHPEEDDCQNKTSNARKPTDYARGYLYPYSGEKLRMWMEQFSFQTGTSFRVRTGKRVNKKIDHHGLANYNGNIVLYSTLETQLYNCALGGRPRKRKVVEGKNKRKERGSKLIGCSAVMHTRLLETKCGWKALEITAPKLLAHLPYHDPRHQLLMNEQEQMTTETVDASSYTTIDFDDPDQSGTAELDLTNNQECFDIRVQPASDETDISTGGTENILEKLSACQQQQQQQEIHTDPRKTSKQILLACAGLLDGVDNLETVSEFQIKSQRLLEFLLKETSLLPSTSSDKKETTMQHSSTAKRKKVKKNPEDPVKTFEEVEVQEEIDCFEIAKTS